MSYAKLRGKITEVFGTIDSFSKAVGISRVTVSKRLNGKSEWNSSDIVKVCEILGITLEDAPNYFFCPKS